MRKQFLDTGKIVGTHGIRGEVRIDPWCDSPEFLCAFKKLYLDENGETFIEVKSRPHKHIVLAKIKGVDTIEQAERLRGKIVYINRADIQLEYFKGLEHVRRTFKHIDEIQAYRIAFNERIPKGLRN